MPVSAAEARAWGEALRLDPVKNANRALSLLGLLNTQTNEAVARVAIQSLKLFFVSAADCGDLSRKRVKVDASSTQPADAGEAEAVFRSWLHRQYQCFLAKLQELLTQQSPAQLQVAALQALLECARHEAGPGVLSAPLVMLALTTLLSSRHAAPEALTLLLEKYLPLVDVRFCALRVVRKLAVGQAAAAGVAPAARRDASDDASDDDADGGGELGAAAGGAPGSGAAGWQLAGGDLTRNLFDVLCHVQPSVPADVSEMASWCGAAEAGLVGAAADAAASAKQRRKRQAERLAAQAGQQAGDAPAAVAAWANARVQRRVYGDAWLALLQMELPEDVYRKALLRLHSSVIPHMASPQLLTDFLTRSLDRGGLDGMLSLNAIFVLVTQHGLEYPAFYRRLYGLLTPSVFLSKHRAQLFRLTDIFLASGLVPAYTAAAFAKRFSRLALTAPPGGALLAIGFIHNLIRRHPSCSVLLHRPHGAAGVAGPAPQSGAAATSPAGAASAAAPAAVAAGVAAGRAAAEDAGPAGLKVVAASNGVPRPGAGSSAGGSSSDGESGSGDETSSSSGGDSGSGGAASSGSGGGSGSDDETSSSDASSSDEEGHGGPANGHPPGAMPNGVHNPSRANSGTAARATQRRSHQPPQQLQPSHPEQPQQPARQQQLQQPPQSQQPPQRQQRAAATPSSLQPQPEAEDAAAPGFDPYNPDEPDPAYSRAVESSLWEVAALRSHYCPQVSTLAAVLDKDLSDRVRTAEVDLMPLLASSYAALLSQETERKLRGPPAVAFYGQEPAGLWDGAELPGWEVPGHAPL